jgi:phosphoglycerate kinase
MFNKQTIRDIDVKNKVVLVRVDYNVPMNDGEVGSDLRIRASLPTIEYLLGHGAKKIVLISHLGRPDGERKAELSLKPVAERLSKIIQENSLKNLSGNLPEVKFVSEVFGEPVFNALNDLSDGGILLLENLRFWPEEEGDDAEFAKKIIEATSAEVFVQDGFAVIHRAHASTDAIPKNLPAVAGLLVEKEVGLLTRAISEPEKPVLVIVGGAKVDDKKPLIEKFLPIADEIFVGGKIAADGCEMNDPKIFVANDFSCDENGLKLDIGVKSTREILEKIHFAKTIIWNGVVGRTETKPFDSASKSIARAIGYRKNAMSIICGGDTTGFVEGVKAVEPELNFSLISTGGGASLELLLGLDLPGISALLEK